MMTRSNAPTSPYTPREIEAFVGRKLRIHAGAAEGVSAQVTRAITAMPAWQQVLLLEAEVDLIAAGQEETLQLYESIRPDGDSKPKGFRASGFNKMPLSGMPLQTVNQCVG